MKSILISAFLWLTFASPALASGDLDGDGAVTAADQDLLSKGLLGKISLNATQQAQADLNGDGNLTVADLVALVNLLDTVTLNLPGTPAVPLVMIRCPATKFKMGHYSGEMDAFNYEAPQHTVTLTKAYCLGKYEVTKRQWQAVMGSTPWAGQSGVITDPNSAAVFVPWPSIAGSGGFISKLNQHLAATGQPGAVRLPTEAEWEAACRAGTTTRYCWGDDLDNALIRQFAWYEVNAQQTPGQAYAHIVGFLLANPWGMFDMSGNVWEWCQDFAGDYAAGAVTDPTGPASGTNRILRGGSWVSPTGHCRSAMRLSREAILSSYNVGFRLAWSESN